MALSFNLADYVPHGLIGALAAAVGIIYKSHVKQDDDRFAQLTASIDSLSKKLDKSIAQTSKNHAQILTILATGRPAPEEAE